MLAHKSTTQRKRKNLRYKWRIIMQRSQETEVKCRLESTISVTLQNNQDPYITFRF